MRSHWVAAVFVLAGAGGLAGCAHLDSAAVVNQQAKEVDPMIVLDVATLDGNSPTCGQYVRNLVVSSDDISDDGLARRVVFLLENASGQDRVEIGTKPGKDNPGKWKRLSLDMDHSIRVTPRVGKGEVKDGTIWSYEIVFQLGNGQNCKIDPGVCIRTQMGGCSGYASDSPSR